MSDNINEKKLRELEKIKSLAAKMGLTDELRALGVIPSTTKTYLDRYITNHPEMLKMKSRVTDLTFIDDPVMILGETGTGKELIANALHGQRAGRFVAINITALSDDLLASELFGHVKGAFTGAHSDKPGLFEVAAGGTLFLDEIGDMPLSAQAKLLRVLQEGKAYRVGSTDEYKVNCRVICATHQNPKDKLRGDLYYRLAVFTVKLLPLRERVDDVDEIFDSLDSRLNVEELISRGIDMSLPGNVRELQMYAKRFKLWGEV